RIVRRVRADADARGLGDEDALDGHPDEVAFELALHVVPGPRRELARDLDAVAFAELGTQARRNQVQRVLAQRRALYRVKGAFVRAAVLLETPLQQDRERGLAARRRSQQQEQASDR